MNDIIGSSPLEGKEEDVKKMCIAILNTNMYRTEDEGGVIGSGAKCPFCGHWNAWDCPMDEAKHEGDCVYLTATDIAYLLGYDPS